MAWGPRWQGTDPQELVLTPHLSLSVCLLSPAALGECPGLDTTPGRGGTMAEWAGQRWTGLNTSPEEPKVQVKWDNNQGTTQSAGRGGTRL